MKKSIVLSIIMFILISTGALAVKPQQISTEKKKQMIQIEERIMQHLRDRHKLAGEAVNIRGWILDEKKRAVWESKDETSAKVKDLSTQLSAKNREIKAKTALIKKETTKLKKLYPKKKKKKIRKKTTKKRRTTAKKRK